MVHVLENQRWPVSVLESTIEGQSRELAKKTGCVLLKIQAARGWPDRLLITPNGEVVWIEFKRPKGVVAPLQLFYHQKLRTMQFQVHVVFSVDQFKSILEDLKRRPGSLMTTNSGPYTG